MNRLVTNLGTKKTCILNYAGLSNTTYRGAALIIKFLTYDEEAQQLPTVIGHQP